MSELISRTKIALVAWWMVIAYFILFSIQAMSISIIGALKDDPNHHGLVTFCVIANTFATMMLAFITQSLGKIKKYESDLGPSSVAGGSDKTN